MVSGIGTAAFGHVAGQLRYEQIGGETYAGGDVNGDALADVMVRLDRVHSLVAGDFVLRFRARARPEASRPA